MAQRYPSKGFVDVCFLDDGITINGSFKKKGIRIRYDYKAIAEAVSGLSTKDQDRGYGLNSTMSIFTRGLRGEMLIISGSGGLLCSGDAQQFYKLGKTDKLKGTLVSVRIPYPSPKVNIYDFIE